MCCSNDKTIRTFPTAPSDTICILSTNKRTAWTGLWDIIGSKNTFVLPSKMIDEGRTVDRTFCKHWIHTLMHCFLHTVNQERKDSFENVVIVQLDFLMRFSSATWHFIRLAEFWMYITWGCFIDSYLVKGRLKREFTGMIKWHTAGGGSVFDERFLHDNAAFFIELSFL